MFSEYDCAIIGGGPAGLTAAIYLARFNRSVILFDDRNGRSTYPQVNENYLGFPEGITARQLRSRGRTQAKNFGAVFFDSKVKKIETNASTFVIEQGKNIYRSKTLLLATGVHDRFPQYTIIQPYIGRSVFWCITCDGYKTRGKKVVIIGKNDEAAETCLQCMNFTSLLTFISNCAYADVQLSDIWRERLQKHNIPVYESIIENINGKNGMVENIVLKDGTLVECEYVFNQQGATPKSDLGRHLGVQSDRYGYILADEQQRTNISCVYAAGDVTKQFPQQIVSASHEGATAAQSINYDLYESWQKSVEDA